MRGATSFFASDVSNALDVLEHGGFQMASAPRSTPRVPAAAAQRMGTPAGRRAVPESRGTAATIARTVTARIVPFETSGKGVCDAAG